jgi:hypothetical protein
MTEEPFVTAPARLTGEQKTPSSRNGTPCSPAPPRLIFSPPLPSLKQSCPHTPPSACPAPRTWPSTICSPQLSGAKDSSIKQSRLPTAPDAGIALPDDGPDMDLLEAASTSRAAATARKAVPLAAPCQPPRGGCTPPMPFPTALVEGYCSR